jgi:tRNA 2-thiouridine synthesizing protein E
MPVNELVHTERTYALDPRGFLADPSSWDMEFCEAMATSLGARGQLTLLQLKVVLFVRRWYVQRGAIPRVYETCRGCGLSLSELRSLFPCGYQRGVCRLAGIPYRMIDSYHNALTYETVARRRRPDSTSGTDQMPAGGRRDGDR